MSETHKPKISEEFKPAPQLKTLYYLYLMLGILFGVLTWYIPVLLVISHASDNAPFVITLVSLPLLGILIFIAYWIPKYYETMQYKLTGNEIVRKRGVWFKQTGIVPYSRIDEYRHNPKPYLTAIRHCGAQNSNRWLFRTTNPR